MEVLIVAQVLHLMTHAQLHAIVDLLWWEPQLLHARRMLIMTVMVPSPQHQHVQVKFPLFTRETQCIKLMNAWRIFRDTYVPPHIFYFQYYYG